MTVDVSELASYAGRIYLREYRQPALPAEIMAIVGAQVEEERRYLRKHAHLVRRLALDLNWEAALDVLGEGGFGAANILFLERAFPFMSASERACWLQYVWCRLKLRPPSIRRVLRLFEAAADLRDTVPADWSEAVTVYRGGWSHPSWSKPLARARRWLRNGISWTTSRDVAMLFTGGRIAGAVGVLGTTTVPRASILAYFHDPETAEFNGRPYKVDGYHEHECVIDPTAVARITYERVAYEDAARALELAEARSQ